RDEMRARGMTDHHYAAGVAAPFGGLALDERQRLGDIVGLLTRIGRWHQAIVEGYDDVSPGHPVRDLVADHAVITLVAAEPSAAVYKNDDRRIACRRQPIDVEPLGRVIAIRQIPLDLRPRR